jgi:hypothetical protein
MAFDERFQDGRNGPLSEALRERLTRFRSMFTLAEIGEEIGFSGAFVSQILNEKHPARVDSKHIDRIVRAVEEAEAKHAKKLGISKQHSGAAMSSSSAVPTGQAKNTLDYHLNAIDSLGWKIMGLERKSASV